MQVLVLVVQNDARPREIGGATATATFFRSVGGSFGVALFGAIFASRLSGALEKLPPESLKYLSGGVHLSPEQAKRLPPEVHGQFLDAFSTRCTASSCSAFCSRSSRSGSPGS